MSRLQNVNVEAYDRLPTPEEVRRELPLGPRAEANVLDARETLRAILEDQAKQFVAKIDRCKHWLDHGAVPSETVSSLLKKNGLDHKQLRLPKPGKPKVAPAEAGEKKAEATA